MVTEDQAPAEAATKTTPEAPKKLGPGCVLAAFALAGLGMLMIFLTLSPDGEAVGTVDLLAPTAVLEVDGKPGDSLTFNNRITTALRAEWGNSWKQRSSAAVRALKDSQLTAIVTGPEGTEQTATCPLWEGSMSSDRPDDGHLTENGVINDCRLVLAAEGKHLVRAKVSWAPSLIVRDASMTVHRER